MRDIVHLARQIRIARHDDLGSIGNAFGGIGSRGSPIGNEGENGENYEPPKRHGQASPLEETPGAPGLTDRPQ